MSIINKNNQLIIRDNTLMMDSYHLIIMNMQANNGVIYIIKNKISKYKNIASVQIYNKIKIQASKWNKLKNGEHHQLLDKIMKLIKIMLIII